MEWYKLVFWWSFISQLSDECLVWISQKVGALLGEQAPDSSREHLPVEKTAIREQSGGWAAIQNLWENTWTVFSTWPLSVLILVFIKGHKNQNVKRKPKLERENQLNSRSPGRAINLQKESRRLPWHPGSRSTRGFKGKALKHKQILDFSLCFPWVRGLGHSYFSAGGAPVLRQPCSGGEPGFPHRALGSTPRFPGSVRLSVRCLLKMLWRISLEGWAQP